MLNQTLTLSLQVKPAIADNRKTQVINSHSLLQGAKTVAIYHNGATYELRATKLGKLILTK